jgi:hypothetical protein
MKNAGTFVNVILAAKMNCAVVFSLISFAFVSQAFAVLRPLFPAKPVPPFDGEVIIIGDNLVLGLKRTPGNPETMATTKSRGKLTGLSKRIRSEASFYSPTPRSRPVPAPINLR